MKGCSCGLSFPTAMQEGSGNINSSSPSLVVKYDTLSLPFQTVKYTLLWERMRVVYCNRCQSHLFTINLSPSGSAGLCLVNQLMKTLQKRITVSKHGLLHISFVFGAVMTKPASSPLGTVVTLPFIVVWCDNKTSNWIFSLLRGSLQSLLPLIWVRVWY